MAFSEHTLTTYRYTGLSGAWWHSGKKRPRPLEKSKWIPKSRPQVAYKTPKGFDTIKLHARGESYGRLKGMKSLRLKDITGLVNGDGGEEEAEGGGEAEESAADDVALASNTVSFEIRDENKRRLVKFARRWGIRANERKVKNAAGEEIKVKPWDVSALPRMAANGDVVPGPVMQEAVKKLQDDIFSLRAQLDWERGQVGVWKQACERFEPPRTGKGKGTKAQRASDRQAWRTLRAVEAHLHAVWCLCDPDESVEGFEKAMAYFVERRGQPGARCAKGRQFFTKRFIALLHEGPLVKKRFEIERRKKHLWAPSAINAACRQGHVGQRQVRKMRRFGSGQIWGNEHLLRQKHDALAYRKCWLQPGADFEFEAESYDPEDPQSVRTAMRTAETAAKARAKMRKEQDEHEIELLKSRMQRELEKAEAKAEAARAEGDGGDEELDEEEELREMEQEDVGPTSVEQQVVNRLLIAPDANSVPLDWIRRGGRESNVRGDASQFEDRLKDGLEHLVAFGLVMEAAPSLESMKATLARLTAALAKLEQEESDFSEEEEVEIMQEEEMDIVQEDEMEEEGEEGEEGDGSRPASLDGAKLVAGVAAFELLEQFDDFALHVDELARDPAAPAELLGVGSLLLADVLRAHMSERGRLPKIVQLHVDVGNLDAISWYTNRGFRDVLEIDGAVALFDVTMEESAKRASRRREQLKPKPLAICMQASGQALYDSLLKSPAYLKSPAAESEELECEHFCPGRSEALFESDQWRRACNVVDAAHARTRGPEKGGSGKTWQHLLQHETGREHYVLALVATLPPVVPKQPPAKKQQPQSASSSKASSSNDEDDPSYGLTCLHHAIAERVMQRSVFNCLTPGAKATSIGYQFHFDKATSKQGPRDCRDWTLGMLSLRCWGVPNTWRAGTVANPAGVKSGVIEGCWGNASVVHAMKDAHSPDLSTVVKAIQGGDGRANQNRHLEKAIQELSNVKKLTLPHALLVLPPTLFEADMTTANPTVRHLAVDNAVNWCDSRLWTVTGTPVDIDGICGVDLAAGMAMADCTFKGDAQSSPFNTTQHNEQARIAELVVLPENQSLKAACMAKWPKCWEAMLAITLWMNDRSCDWSDVTRKPEWISNEDHFETECSSKAAGKRRASATTGGSTKKGKKQVPMGRGVGARSQVTRVPEEATAADGRWANAHLQQIGFVFDEFEPDMADDEDGLLQSNHKRIVRMPCIDAFGRDLANPLGGDDRLFRLLSTLCGLHCEMRVSERIVAWAQRALTTRFESGGGTAVEKAIDTFNRVMKSELHLRHAIKLDDKKKVYPVTLDGRDAGRLREDWLRLERGVVKGADGKLTSSSEPGRFDANRRAPPSSGKYSPYPSIFFSAVHSALVEAGAAADMVDALPEIAEAACHYAKAMGRLRMSPEALRALPGGAERAHNEFEAESRLFCAAWRFIGAEWKAYEYHLWTNMPGLFRRWGCMEAVSQQGDLSPRARVGGQCGVGGGGGAGRHTSLPRRCDRTASAKGSGNGRQEPAAAHGTQHQRRAPAGMEGTVGRLSQMLGRIAWHVRGRYKNGMTPPEREEELARRRAAQAPPAQKVIEEFMMDAQESTTEHLPSKRHETRLSLKEIQLRIDKDIKEGRVITYQQYVGYWQRWIAASTIRCVLRGRVQARGNQAYYQSLLKEHKEYYEERAMGSKPGPFGDREWSKRTLAISKKAYHIAAKKKKTVVNGKTIVKHGRLVYQQWRGQNPRWKPAQWF